MSVEAYMDSIIQDTLEALAHKPSTRKMETSFASIKKILDIDSTAAELDRRDQRGFLYPVNKGAYSIRSQDLQKAYYETGPFSIFNRQHIFSKKPVKDEGFISYIIP